MMREFEQPVLAERYVEGREINVTLIGNGDTLQVLPLHEIDFAAMPADRPHIVSYAAKWEEDHVDFVGTKPVPLRDAPPAMVAAVEQIARRRGRRSGCRDYGRIDLRVDKAGHAWVIDINPNCDISPDAGVARSAKVAGFLTLSSSTTSRRPRGGGSSARAEHVDRATRLRLVGLVGGRRIAGRRRSFF